MGDRRMCTVNRTPAIVFPHPAAHEQDFMGPRGEAVSKCIIRFKHKSTLDKRETLLRPCGHASVDFGKRAKNEVVGGL